MDPTNAVYSKVFFGCWPEAVGELGFANEETMGDVFESLLGIHWMKAKKKLQMSDLAEGMIMMLEKTLIAEWLLSCNQDACCTEDRPFSH